MSWKIHKHKHNTPKPETDLLVPAENRTRNRRSRSACVNSKTTATITFTFEHPSILICSPYFLLWMNFYIDLHTLSQQWIHIAPYSQHAYFNYITNATIPKLHLTLFRPELNCILWSNWSSNALVPLSWDDTTNNNATQRYATPRNAIRQINNESVIYFYRENTRQCVYLNRFQKAHYWSVYQHISKMCTNVASIRLWTSHY